MRKPATEVHEQQFIYGVQNLIADIGGYLGLLLGLSIFTIYQIMISFLVTRCPFSKEEDVPNTRHS